MTPGYGPLSVTDATEHERLLDAVLAALEHDATIGRGKGFGSEALKVGGRIFAMQVKGDLVVKLPKERVDDLIATGEGTRFDPGHGRLMIEWVAVPPSDAEQWVRLAEEARAYVSSGR